MFEEARAQLEAGKQFKIDSEKAMAEMLADMRYAVSKDGSVLDLTFFAPLIAWHLVRCGWRNDESARVIKSRKITAAGVVADAVEWVPVAEPDDPLADLENMTMAEINELTPTMRALALRRMGGAELPDLPTNPGWKVATRMRIQDVPDTNDGTSWTGREGDTE